MTALSSGVAQTSELPLFLAGPIVRRADRNAIWIWLCSREEVVVEASVYLAATIDAKPIGGGRGTVVQAGRRCYIQMVKLVPHEARFPNGKFLYYDLRTVDSSPRENDRLWGLEAWIPKDSICAAQFNAALPFIVLNVERASSTNPLRGIFSSCRKALGKGEDAIRLVDNIWRDKSVGSAGGATALHFNLMIGDQIYADDVHSLLRPLVTTLAEELIGRVEAASIDGMKSRLSSRDVGESRAALLKKALVTSGDRACHCVFLGEFLALYICAFATARLDEIVVEPALRRGLGIGNNVQSEREKAQLRAWLDGKRTLRRVFANVPTYFLPDDHEVSDDWNISKVWIDAAQATSGPQALLGQTLVPAALTAFFLFQGWGNEPERPDISPKDMDAMARALKTYIEGPTERELSMDVVRRWHWDFLTPTTPPIVMLDTRTYREERKVTSKVAVPTFAGLARWSCQDDVGTILMDTLGAGRLQDHLKQAADAYNEACILVSPCAFFSADAQKTASQYFTREIADREDWDSSHPLSIKILADAFRKHGIRTVCLLAGDIHYGYRAEGSLKKSIGVGLFDEVNFIEIVSSACLNYSLLPALGARKTLRCRSARWFEPTANTVYSASGDLIDIMVKEKGLPDLEVETRRLERVFENNIGLITIKGGMPTFSLLC